jgi:putative glutamine amidotransferase
VRRAHARGTPVLGICRGAQVINIAHGGTLWQHLPETHGSDEHRRAVGRFDGNDHEVLLTPGSRAAAAAGEERHRVLSHHHQGIRDVGDGLVASGFADDGVVETVESGEERAWLLGVQWHPEADPSSRVIAALVDAAARTRRG